MWVLFTPKVGLWNSYHGVSKTQKILTKNKMNLLSKPDQIAVHTMPVLALGSRACW